jgi:hypothetical protein
MRLLVVPFLLALLGGCSTPASLRDAWTWDATQPQSKAMVPADEVSALSAQAARLQQERNDIRGRISTEPDIRARQRLYEDLHRVGLRLSRVERRLSNTVAAR